MPPTPQTLQDVEALESLPQVDVYASRTLEPTDIGKLLKLYGGAIITLPYVEGADPIIIGAQVAFVDMSGSGSRIAISGGTIYSNGYHLHLNGQYATAAAMKLGSNLWLLSGNLYTPPA